MAEFDLPGGVWRGEPLLREAETEALNIHAGTGRGSLGWWWTGLTPTNLGWVLAHTSLGQVGVG